MDNPEQENFERLRATLQAAFAAPECDYLVLTAADVIARNRHDSAEATPESPAADRYADPKAVAK